MGWILSRSYPLRKSQVETQQRTSTFFCHQTKSRVLVFTYQFPMSNQPLEASSNRSFPNNFLPLERRVSHFNDVVVPLLRCRPGSSLSRTRLSVAHATEMVPDEVICQVQNSAAQKCTRTPTDMHAQFQMKPADICEDLCFSCAAAAAADKEAKNPSRNYAAAVFQWSFGTLSV